MIDVGAESAAPGAGTAEKALSFISRGWREVRDSAGADLRLMRARASSFKSLADREFENLLSSSAAVLSTPPRPSPPEVEFVKRIQPKLSEIRRAYSSPDFSRRVLEKWSPKATIRIDLSAIRNAIVSEVDEVGAVLDVGKVKGQSWRMVRWKGVEEEEQGREWEPIRILKTGLKELERKSQSTSNELVEKLKSSLGSFVKERQESKEVPPLDLPELLAYFVKQSGPFFNQLGIRQDICDKIVEALCSRRKDQLMYHSLSAKDTSLPGNENSDELDLRIASVLESMTLVNKMVKPRVIGAFKMCRVEIPTFSSYESLVIRVEKWTSWTSY